MNRIIKALVFIFLIIVITSCSDKKPLKTEKEESKSFNATIVECYQNSMIVRPLENEMELKSADRILVDFIGDYNTCNVNDLVRITYAGGINESYPAQIGVLKIENIN